MNPLVSVIVFPIVVPTCLVMIGTMACFYAIGMSINGGRIED